MRKFAAILLLVILLFNWVGYRFLSSYLQHRSDLQLEAKLDKNQYDEKDLIEIKVPLHLPYQLNWREFERFDGEIDIEGVHYKYVKRKVYNDSLVLLCLPNTSKQNLEKAKDDYFKVVNDINPSSQKKSDQQNLSFKNLLTEFFVEQQGWAISICECLHHKHYVRQTVSLYNTPHNPPAQPPDVTLL